jgi:hypothetical protein
MSSLEYKIVVFNKLPDQEAITAFHTLTEFMGYKDLLTGLNRAKYFKVLSQEISDPDAKIQEILERTTLFLNPNKEYYRILNNDLDILFKKNEDAVINKFVLVKDIEEKNNIANELHKRWGFEEITGIYPYVLWNLQFKEDIESVDDLVGEIVRLRSREEGLLANPHSQEYELI